ncbi:MAG: hypothetical protein K2G12_08035, partial [Prevotella sp.]|nr:hypothetical protein [Prevotella sp.]
IYNDMENNREGFEDIQCQIDLLKKKLDKEKIINERLMRKAMSSRVNSVERYLWRVLSLGVVAMVLMALDFIVLFPLSLPFVLATELGLLCCIVFICINKRLVSSDNIMSGNLIEASMRLARFKKREIRYICVSIPLSVLWITWLVFEIRVYAPDEESMYSMLSGITIGGIIGFSIGINMFRKMLRNVNDVLSQIEELTCG